MKFTPIILLTAAVGTSLATPLPTVDIATDPALLSHNRDAVMRSQSPGNTAASRAKKHHYIMNHGKRNEARQAVAQDIAHAAFAFDALEKINRAGYDKEKRKERAIWGAPDRKIIQNLPEEEDKSLSDGQKR